MDIGRIPRIASKLLYDADARQELKRRVNILSEGGYAEIFQRLPIFVPTSGGPAKDLASLTLTAARESFPILVAISEAVGKPVPPTIDHASFCDDAASIQNAKILGELFEKYGSDKTFHH